jgi:hypothetical protein
VVHHRVEEEGEFYALSFDRQLERISVAVERPGALSSGMRDVLFVVAPEEAVSQCAVLRFVNELNGIRGEAVRPVTMSPRLPVVALYDTPIPEILEFVIKCG